MATIEDLTRSNPVLNHALRLMGLLPILRVLRDAVQLRENWRLVIALFVIMTQCILSIHALLLEYFFVTEHLFYQGVVQHIDPIDFLSHMALIRHRCLSVIFEV